MNEAELRAQIAACLEGINLTVTLTQSAQTVLSKDDLMVAVFGLKDWTIALGTAVTQLSA